MPQKKFSFLHRIKLHGRLAIAATLGAALLFFAPADWRWATRLLVAWDAATLLYIALVATMMARATNESIRRRADVQDEGGIALLLLTVLSAVVSLAAIFAELSLASKMQGDEKIIHTLLAGVTVVLSWVFMQTVFALHYAHIYYASRNDNTCGGLIFPAAVNKKIQPDYWDFCYYSFVIGTSTAVSDVDVTERIMRRITGVHCVVAFFFNTTILALAINIGAGLLQ